MQLSDNAYEVLTARYFQPNEDWQGLSDRVGYFLGDTEWGETFSELIYNGHFIPAGRILRNSGVLNQGLLNCACLPVADNIESIGELHKDALTLWAYGAGIGVQYSTLRPMDAPIVTRGGKSSGMLSFIDTLDYASRVIDTGGQRRSGLMPIVRVDHPDIFGFVYSKEGDAGKLKYCNLSVGITEEFIRAVEDEATWELKFAGKVYNKVDARNLWEAILDSQIKNGEPGLINFTNLLKNNSYYFQPITGTNLCGELPLSNYGMCCLGSLVLPMYLSPSGQTNWKMLESDMHIAVRLLDIVLDKNVYPIPQTRQVTLDSRRIGLGTMGLAEYLMAKKVKYGSEESINEVEKLFKFLRNTAYEASIKLAEEKGAFPMFNSEYGRASFIRKLPRALRQSIKEKGIRNCTLLSSPPTGTTSLIPEVTPSIEPIYSLAYLRQDRVSDRYYLHPSLVKHFESGEPMPEWLVDVSMLKPSDHLEVQASVQKFTDNAVSKTINFPKGTKSSELSEYLLEYMRDLKGVTVYVDGSRGEQPLVPLSLKDAKKLWKEGKVDSNQDEMECHIGGCEI